VRDRAVKHGSAGGAGPRHGGSAASSVVSGGGGGGGRPAGRASTAAGRDSEEAQGAGWRTEV